MIDIRLSKLFNFQRFICECIFAVFSTTLIRYLMEIPAITPIKDVAVFLNEADSSPKTFL